MIIAAYASLRTAWRSIIHAILRFALDPCFYAFGNILNLARYPPPQHSIKACDACIRVLIACVVGAASSDTLPGDVDDFA
jgi:hypothetical protein